MPGNISGIGISSAHLTPRVQRRSRISPASSQKPGGRCRKFHISLPPPASGSVESSGRAGNRIPLPFRNENAGRMWEETICEREIRPRKGGRFPSGDVDDEVSERIVSRILFRFPVTRKTAMIIPLRRPLPAAFSDTTREHRGGPPRSPIWSCSGWGLPSFPGHPGNW
jgi:hypothetical protein